MPSDFNRSAMHALAADLPNNSFRVGKDSGKSLAILAFVPLGVRAYHCLILRNPGFVHGFRAVYEASPTSSQSPNLVSGCISMEGLGSHNKHVEGSRGHVLFSNHLCIK